MIAFRQPTTDTSLLAEAERVHHAWNDALATGNVEAITALYAEDATIESPLVRYLLGKR
jgi:ketosteroid isomerase-like protein